MHTANNQSINQRYFQKYPAQFFLRKVDAHLKNFGIVNTTAYLLEDTPALTLFGKKQLIKFDTEQCKLFLKEAEEIYQHCLTAMLETKAEMIQYIKITLEYKEIGNKIITRRETVESGETLKRISHNC